MERSSRAVGLCESTRDPKTVPCAAQPSAASPRSRGPGCSCPLHCRSSAGRRRQRPCVPPALGRHSLQPSHGSLSSEGIVLQPGRSKQRCWLCGGGHEGGKQSQLRFRALLTLGDRATCQSHFDSCRWRAQLTQKGSSAPWDCAVCLRKPNAGKTLTSLLREDLCA